VIPFYLVLRLVIVPGSTGCAPCNGPQDMLSSHGRVRPIIREQPLFARFQELLAPAVIQVGINTFTAADRGKALLTTQSFKYNTDLLLGIVLLAGLSFLYLGQWHLNVFWLASGHSFIPRVADNGIVLTKI